MSEIRTVHIKNGEPIILELKDSQIVNFVIDEPLTGPVSLQIEPISYHIESSKLGAEIPGHPNCHVGDCLDCHVVSCAIYQGYEKMP